MSEGGIDLGTVLLGLYLFLALWFWVLGYRSQRARTRLEEQRHLSPEWDQLIAGVSDRLMAVPHWVAWACGKPAGAGQVWAPASFLQLQGWLTMVWTMIVLLTGLQHTRPWETLIFIMAICCIAPLAKSLQGKFR